MSAAKERIIGAVTVMREEEAARIWDFIKVQFGFAEDEPSEDEIKIIQAYKNKDNEYQPYISNEELKQDLGL